MVQWLGPIRPISRAVDWTSNGHIFCPAVVAGRTERKKEAPWRELERRRIPRSIRFAQEMGDGALEDGRVLFPWPAAIFLLVGILQLVDRRIGRLKKVAPISSPIRITGGFFIFLGL